MAHERPANVLRIGLTGGIASGKSAVAEHFAGLGIPVIDTDAIARRIVAPGTPALGDIVAAFGPHVLRGDGQLDRAAMRRIVFADDAKRRQLEAILHPRIRAAAAAQSAAAGGPYQIVVVPLLAESPMKGDMDRILVVDVPRELQLERLLKRDAGDREQAQRMIDAQAGRDERLAIADDIIRNDGDLAATRRQVEALHRQYVAMSNRASNR